MKPKIKSQKLQPGGELEEILREATQTVEDELKLEDAGWYNFTIGSDIITPAARIDNLKLSRLYAIKDPLGKQSIRLWTDYTFGTGMTWSVDDENKQTKNVLDAFWGSKANRKILSAAGQRRSSDKLLIDGVVYFAIFLGKESTIRNIDPLEITEIITDPDDKENERYYRRKWIDSSGGVHESIYRSISNLKDEAAKDATGKEVKKTDDAVVYRLEYNDGNPLLLPALDWIKQYRRFLASRVAVMLAIARFAWKTKVKGGQTQVSAIKAKTHQQEIAAGSTLLENMGSDTSPIRTDSGASSAYQDGKMVKYQICAAVGIPEQYFGDISTGNLATAKTVELPMQKMFQSYQAVWNDAYQDIDEIILEYNKVPPDRWYVDRDFPNIAPEDILAAATAMVAIIGAMPNLAASPDVQQLAMMYMGVNDPAEALDALKKAGEETPEEPQEEPSAETGLISALRRFKESIKESTIRRQ